MFPRGPGKELPRGAILPRFPVVVSRLRLPARATAVWSGMVHSAENGGAHDLFLPRIPIRSHADRRPGHSPRVSPTRRMGRRWLPGRRLSRWLQSRFCQSRISPWLRRTALRLRRPWVPPRFRWTTVRFCRAALGLCRTPFWFCRATCLYRARLRRAATLVVVGATSALVVGTATATLVGLGASSLVKTGLFVAIAAERPNGWALPSPPWRVQRQPSVPFQRLHHGPDAPPLHPRPGSHTRQPAGRL